MWVRNTNKRMGCISSRLIGNIQIVLDLASKSLARYITAIIFPSGVSHQYRNWDGRPIKLGPARNFNKFSLVYFIDGLPERDREEILAYNMPRTYFVDIETEIVDGFPKAEEAKEEKKSEKKEDKKQSLI